MRKTANNSQINTEDLKKNQSSEADKPAADSYLLTWSFNLCGFGAGLSVRFGSVLRFLPGFGSGVYPFTAVRFARLFRCSSFSLCAATAPTAACAWESARVREDDKPPIGRHSGPNREKEGWKKEKQQWHKQKEGGGKDGWMDGWRGGACPRGEEDEEEGRCSGGRQIGQCIIMMNSV